MKQIKKTVIIALWIVGLIGGGLAALVMRLSADTAKVSSYNEAIQQARIKAEKGINYYAKQDYLRAFSVYAGEQELFREFLSFLEKAEDGTYREYLGIYLEKYPYDVEAYEKLAELYYVEENYKRVQEVLNGAASAGVKSEKLGGYWEEVRYKFADLAGGYSDISELYGQQAVVERNGKKGLYMHGSGLVLPVNYEELSFLVNGALAVKEGEECYFADIAGHKSGVLSVPVDSLSILANGFCAISIDGKYGYVTSGLQVPENLPFDYASAFSNGVAGVKVGDKWGIVDTTGAYVTEPIYEEILLTEFDTIVSAGIIFARENGGYVMLDTGGNKMTQDRFEEVCGFHYLGQPAAVRRDGNWLFIQADGQYVDIPVQAEKVKSFSGGLAPVSLDGLLWGYMDMNGQIVIEPQFDDCRQFSEYGIAPVKKGDIWSMIQLLSCR